jgi:hypothetical protein
MRIFKQIFSAAVLFGSFISSCEASEIKICGGKLSRPGAFGYNTTSSPVKEKLNVHLIPHSHDDP